MKKKVERKIERKVEQDLSLIQDTRVCNLWYVHSTNMIQRYNHGKFESLCRERTKKR